MGQENMKNVYDFVKIAVTGAEQIFLGSGQGAIKKEEVLRKVKDYCLKYVTADQLDDIVESIVFEINKNLKKEGLEKTE
jgi:hypothetical protein